MTAVFLCTADHVCGDRGDGFGPECQNCGGSATLGDTQEAFRFDHGTFCSMECADEAVEFQERVAAERAALYACCDDCGFDRSEHSPTCSNIGECSHASARRGNVTVPVCDEPAVVGVLDIRVAPGSPTTLRSWS